MYRTTARRKGLVESKLQGRVLPATVACTDNGAVPPTGILSLSTCYCIVVNGARQKEPALEQTQQALSWGCRTVTHAPEQHQLDLITLQPQIHKERQHRLNFVWYAYTTANRQLWRALDRRC